MPLSTSTTSIASGRSRMTISHSLPSRKLKQRWWQRRPIISTAFITDLQKGSYIAAIYTLIQSILQIIIAVFDAYCLFEARKGSRHFRTFGFSFLFVYSGNENVRLSLIACSMILIMVSIYLLASSIILMAALRKEHEVKFRHWLRSMGLFIILRLSATIFQSVANDLYFLYHQLMLILWFTLLIVNVFVFLVVVSNYQELSNITRLEDMAKLKMSTLSSLNASRSLSHHSLDSYKGITGVNIHPSPSVSVQGTPATARALSGTAVMGGMSGGIGGGGSLGGGGGSISSTAGSLNNFAQASPKVGYPPMLNAFPLSAFGLNLNPSGSQPSPRSQQGSLGAGSYTGRGSTPSTAPI